MLLSFFLRLRNSASSFLSPLPHSPQGVPSKDYKLPASWLKEGVAVINVSTFKNVNEDDIMKVRGNVLYFTDLVATLFGMRTVKRDSEVNHKSLCTSRNNVMF